MKKQSVADVFKTAKSVKHKEVLNAIKKYCTQVTRDDLQEIHKNAVAYFGLNEQDFYFDVNNFWNEIKTQKALKEAKNMEQNKSV